MAKATTKAFHKFLLKLETTPGSGIFTALCGLTSRGINREHNMSETEVPDCADESLPAAVERAVQSSSVTMEASGVYAAESHKRLYDWWANGVALDVQIEYVDATAGQIRYEEGPAYLTGFNNSVARGEKLSAELSIAFDGVPAVTLVP